MYDTDFFFRIAVYLLVGLIVGYSTQQKNDKIRDQHKSIEEHENKYEFLNGIYVETREVKDELQLRILNSGDSFGKIYSITKELDSLEPEKVFTSTVGVIKSLLNVKAAAIYSVGRNSNYLRLISHINDSDIPSKNSIKVEENAYVQRVLRDGEIFVNKHLDSDAPMMAAPIYHHGKIAARLTIDVLPFEKFSL
jgi:transcriptional regulator with GAF, ATPase, and Fis domain